AFKVDIPRGDRCRGHGDAAQSEPALQAMVEDPFQQGVQAFCRELTVQSEGELHLVGKIDTRVQPLEGEGPGFRVHRSCSFRNRMGKVAKSDMTHLNGVLEKGDLASQRKVVRAKTP